MSKMDDLLDVEGYDNIDEAFDELMTDSVNPGICMNSGCDYTTTVEPDSREGWCEMCGTNTVRSFTELALF